MRRRLILSLLILISIFTLVGGGFSLFIFANNIVQATQNVDASVEKKDESGDIELVYENEEGDYVKEFDNPHLKTKLEFNFDSVIYKRSDKPIQERKFILKYSPILDVVSKKLSINCLIKIKDNDDKGVTINSSPQYPKSNSIIDIFKPTSVETKIVGETSFYSFSAQEESNLAHEATYRVTIFKNRTITTLDFIYFETRFIHEYLSSSGLSFAPSSSTSEEVIKKKIESNINAMKNSSIELIFTLEITA